MIAFNKDKVLKFIDEKNKEGLSRRKWGKMAYSRTQFARENDINTRDFIGMLGSNSWIPTSPTLYKIAKGMGCTMEELLIITKY